MNSTGRHGYSTPGDHRLRPARLRELRAEAGHPFEGTARHYRRLATAAQIAGLLEDHTPEERAAVLAEVDAALKLGG